jgi:hypothetical protein
VPRDDAVGQRLHLFLDNLIDQAYDERARARTVPLKSRVSAISLCSELSIHLSTRLPEFYRFFLHDALKLLWPSREASRASGPLQKKQIIRRGDLPQDELRGKGNTLQLANAAQPPNKGLRGNR